MAGRKPKSIKAILAEGNKSHLTKEEIEQRQLQEETLDKLKNDKVKPPTWLGKLGKKVFKDIVLQMKELDILKNVDVYGLAITADAMDKYIQCTIALHTEELSIESETRTGFTMIENPLVKTQRKYADLFHKYSANYGLSPAARLKIVTQNMPEIDPDDTEFEREFG